MIFNMKMKCEWKLNLKMKIENGNWRWKLKENWKGKVENWKWKIWRRKSKMQMRIVNEN